MTQEGQGPRPDETRSPLTPPASTRWSEEPVEDAPDLAPPFVGGRHAEGGRGPDAERLAAETAEAVTAPAPSEPETAPADEPAPFPFETGPEPDSETAPVAAEDEDFPFDQFDIEGDQDAAGAASDEEPEPWGELPEEPAPWAETVAGAVEEAPAAGLPTEPESGPEGGEGVGAPVGGPAEEMASLLERLARAIREDGEAGVRREIDSPDRITSLIAGLLAGHLSARS